MSEKARAETGTACGTNEPRAEIAALELLVLSDEVYVWRTVPASSMSAAMVAPADVQVASTKRRELLQVES